MRSFNAIEQTLCLRVSASSSSKLSDLKNAVVSEDFGSQLGRPQEFALVEDIVKKP